ncbi:glycerol-1-phosphate dehydrogenase [NAD(P)+] [Elusimicrobium simillimum]|uniref:iron-containing alcohol dehydrogenase family protein n=1 Tax=Elusimicrobium simillimum TaxID=3143438 RepID=UPI003C6F168B
MRLNKEINIPSLLKIDSGKIRKIGKYLSDRKFIKTALFFSEGIEALVADNLYTGFKEFGIEVTHKADISDINIENIIHTAFKIPAGVNVLIGIGGGKSLDYSKYCAHVLKLPFISVPTSVSNDGFCSPNASLMVDGKRRSVKSSMPYGVVADLDVIAGAPAVTLYSGLGDIISKITALWDWKQAFLKHGEDHSDFAALISRNSLDVLFNEGGKDIKSYEFQYKLVNSLVLSGVAMEIAGSSRPASGSEHLISHALDALSPSPHMHGIQVGVAAYLCSMLQGNSTDIIRTFLIRTGFADFVEKAPFSKADFIAALKMAPYVKANYYTILSEADSFDKAAAFIESDDLLKKFIR